MNPTSRLGPSRGGDQRDLDPRQLAWLRHELTRWQDDGLVDPSQVPAILSSYRAVADRTATSTLGRILLWLGGAFVGVGLIWLVAANLEQLSPMARFVAVATLWLSFLAGSEILAARHASRPLTGALRLVAALTFGAMLFQAAQSLQVPAFDVGLIGVWAAGALAHGYLTRATAPFLVGLAAGIGWWVSQPLGYDDASPLTAVITLGSGAVLAMSLAVVHDLRSAAFAWWWRLAGAALALAALFVAAVPGIHGEDFEWSAWLTGEVASSAAAFAAAMAVAVVRDRWSWVDPAGAAAVLVVSVLLSMWDVETDVTDVADVSTGLWGHAALSVLAYVLVAIGVAVLAIHRGHGALTWVAMSALVVFTTFQSFAVFAPIVAGAWLFVVLGTVFLGTGFLFDRARRELTAVLDGDALGATSEGADR